MKLIKQTGLLSLISAANNIDANNIEAKIQKLHSNAADSLAMARKMNKEAGLLNKKEARLFKRQAKLLERQAKVDSNQADLYRKHLKLSHKFN